MADDGVDVNARGRHGVTPLWWAMRSANKVGFKRLLELGADPNVWTDNDYGPSAVMMDAASADDTEWLELVLEHGGDPNLSEREFGTTPLFSVASSLSRTKAVRLLIEAGADMNHRSEGGGTPMIHAAMVNAFDVVLQLIEAGADYRLKTDGGMDLAYWTVSKSGSVDPTSDAGKARDRVEAFLEKNGYDLEPIKKNVAKELEEACRKSETEQRMLEETARKVEEQRGK